MNWVDTEEDTRIRQGDIFSDVEYFLSFSEEAGVAEIKKIRFPHAIVLTQDCDLAQDNDCRSSKTNSTDNAQLLSVLMAPMYNAEHFRRGEHLSELNLDMLTWGSEKYKTIKSNNNPRYHYLDPGPVVAKLVPVVIDFKHYFSVRQTNLKEIYKKGFLCTVKALYREDVAQRFAAFLSRIALPQ